MTEGRRVNEKSNMNSCCEREYCERSHKMVNECNLRITHYSSLTNECLIEMADDAL